MIEVAKGIGFTRKALSEFVNGKSGMSPEMAIRLAKAFLRPRAGLTCKCSMTYGV